MCCLCQNVNSCNIEEMLKSNDITFKECKHWNPLRKVCIMAFDGLGYDLVEKFNLKKLKQVEYGKVDVSDFEQFITPYIWASFITGLDYKQLKAETYVLVYNNSS